MTGYAEPTESGESPGEERLRVTSPRPHTTLVGCGERPMASIT
jgi:hypothetical protein